MKYYSASAFFARLIFPHARIYLHRSFRYRHVRLGCWERDLQGTRGVMWVLVTSVTVDDWQSHERRSFWEMVISEGKPWWSCASIIMLRANAKRYLSCRMMGQFETMGLVRQCQRWSYSGREVEIYNDLIMWGCWLKLIIVHNFVELKLML